MFTSLIDDVKMKIILSLSYYMITSYNYHKINLMMIILEHHIIIIIILVPYQAHSRLLGF